MPLFRAPIHARYSSAASESFHSPCGRAGHFSCSCKKSNQKNTPRQIAPFGRPARKVRVVGRAALTAHPCADSAVGAIPRADPCGALSTAAAAIRRGPQDQEQRALRLLAFGVPVIAAARSAMPEGAARWIAPIPASAQGCAVAGTQRRAANSRAKSGSAISRGVFLLVTFLCTSKEKLPARPQGEWKPFAHRREEGKDAGFPPRERGNDEQEGVLAFAGKAGKDHQRSARP
jgi:hypothetical protein